eukprot:1148937-Pelagomonas_calceolata.AAC.12
MRPGQQLEAAERQHTDLYKLISAKAVTLLTILLGVGGTYETPRSPLYVHQIREKVCWHVRNDAHPEMSLIHHV